MYNCHAKVGSLTLDGVSVEKHRLSAWRVLLGDSSRLVGEHVTLK